MERRFPAAAALTVLLSLLVSLPRLLRWRPRQGGGAGGGEAEAEVEASPLALSPEALSGLQVYRLVTYIFVYDDPLSYLCSMIVVWYFAGSFEKSVGTAKHSLLTMAFAVATALLYLLLLPALAKVLEAADATGFSPVAFAMLAASIARSPLRNTLFLGFNVRVSLVPWLLLGVAWSALISPFLANLCGILIGNLYGYGFCSRVDLPESAASRLDQKIPFRLLKRIPALQYVSGSLAERRASQTRKINPVPGSYPTQCYQAPPPPAFFAVPPQHPNTHTYTSGLPTPPGPSQLPTASAFGVPDAHNHFHTAPGSFSSSPHLVGSDSWASAGRDGSSAHQVPELPESCRVHVG